jgi:uncharacterized protein (TIGR02594 family)
MTIPSKYAYLGKEPGPKMLLEALKLLGIKETPGDADNPVILEWAKELGGDVAKTYRDDMIPWCGLFVGVVAKRAGWTPPKTPLWARAWAEFGAKAEVPSLGDICVFTRNGGGHVALYVGEDATHYHILGGNQGDAVTIVRKAKKDCIAVRRPVWKIAAPANRRPIKLSATGAVVSKKED